MSRVAQLGQYQLHRPLETGVPLLDSIIRCRRIRASSRQWLLWSWFSHSSGRACLSLSRQSVTLGVDVATVRRSSRQIVAAGMFLIDGDGSYRRAYLEGETPAQFERREQRHQGLESRLSVAWALAAMVHKTGVARRSLGQLSTDLGLHRATVERAGAFLVEVGLFSRYGGHGTTPMMWTSEGATGPVRDSLIDRYGPHRERYQSSKSVAQSSKSVAQSSKSVATPRIYRSKKAEESPTKLRASPGASGAPPPYDREDSAQTGPASETTRPRYNQPVAPTAGSSPVPKKDRVVILFPDSRPIPAVRRSGGMARRDEVVDVVVDLVARVRRERSKQITEPSQLASWRRLVHRLVRRLDGPEPAGRVLRVVRWYLDHWGDDEYIPRVESGQSLLDKFDRLEAAMERRAGPRDEPLPDDALARLGAGQLRRSFEEVLVPLARGLRLGGTDAALARALVDLHARLLEERVTSSSLAAEQARMGGLVDLVRRYLVWVGEQDWPTATLRVLRHDSPSLAQFRRDEAGRDARDRDPVTGRSR